MDPLPLTLPEPHILTDPNTLITFTKENTHSRKNTLHREAGIWPLHPDAHRWGQDAAPLTPGPAFCFFPNRPEPQFSCWGSGGENHIAQLRESPRDSSGIYT